MELETSGSDGGSRPKFRGCVCCYSAEWAYYGAKKAVRSISSTSD